jgi:hypothetical protein
MRFSRTTSRRPTPFSRQCSPPTPPPACCRTTSRAVESLSALARAHEKTFDLVFTDAGRPSNPEYLGVALALTRAGSVIVADNVERDGTVVEEGSAEPSAQGVRRFMSWSPPSRGWLQRRCRPSARSAGTDSPWHGWSTRGSEPGFSLDRA